MMAISNGNIDQLKFYICFIVDEFDFMIWIEKIGFRNETFKKNEIWMQKSLTKLVKIYGKNKVSDVFLIWWNGIKSWTLFVELLNISDSKI